MVTYYDTPAGECISALCSNLTCALSSSLLLKSIPQTLHLYLIGLSLLVEEGAEVAHIYRSLIITAF